MLIQDPLLPIHKTKRKYMLLIMNGIETESGPSIAGTEAVATTGQPVPLECGRQAQNYISCTTHDDRREVKAGSRPYGHYVSCIG